jgi:DNA-binding transcriptional ArsR family regulator
MSPDLPLPDQDASRLALWFAGFADVTRLQILAELSQGDEELSCWDFACRFVRTTSDINHHLRRLCESGLVVSRREGRRRMYRLAGPWVPAILNVSRGLLPSPTR